MVTPISTSLYNCTPSSLLGGAALTIGVTSLALLCFGFWKQHSLETTYEPVKDDEIEGLTRFTGNHNDPWLAFDKSPRAKILTATALLSLGLLAAAPFLQNPRGNALQ